MLKDGRVIVDVHIRERMRTAVRTQQQRVTRAVVAGIVGR